MFRSPKTQRFEPGAYDGQTDGSVQRYQQRKEQVLDVLKKELEELTLGDDDKQQQQLQGRDERNERNGFDLQLSRPQLSQMSQTLHGTPVRLTLYTIGNFHYHSKPLCTLNFSAQVAWSHWQDVLCGGLVRTPATASASAAGAG